MSEPNWDPTPQERVWYRDATSGQLGWMVRRDGEDKIRLDRPLEEICLKYIPGAWKAQTEHRPLNPAEVAQVAFAADCRLSRAIGIVENSKKEWQSLDDDQRIAWMSTGPTKDPLRAELFRAITGALEKYTK